MKEANKLSEVESIKVHNTLGLYYKNVSGDLYSLDENELVAQSVYDFNFINNGFVYTQSEIGDLFVLMKDGSKKKLSGFFYLAFFKRLLHHYALVKNDSPNDLTNKVILIDQFFEEQKLFKSFRTNVDGYFATGKSNEIIVFDENLTEIWKRGLTEIDSSLSRCEKLPRTFYAACQTLIVPLESGQLLALDISTGELKWKQERIGKTVIFEDKIYSLNSKSLHEFEIRVFDAKSGKIIQSKEVTNLDKEYGFRPTGHHQVYNEYIFVMSSRKPGFVAIFYRETLEFREMIRIEESIPNDMNHLIWHEGKLYVLDFGKTLHIYE
jgi:hypothetical protein